LASCGPDSQEQSLTSADVDNPAILQVGSMTLFQSDLLHHLKEKSSGRFDDETRAVALDELTKRAQLAQAALDAHLDEDAAVRAETARILSNRFKEEALHPMLKAIVAPIPEARLREIYQNEQSRFQSKEKRQTAVLWLDSGGNPQREKQYTEKLEAARDWFSQSSDLKKHPEQGFSVLSVDYSEHQATRYKGGVVGWMESGGGMDPWSKAVAEMVYSLDQPGDISEVVARPEGVFVVRYMALKPALLRSFESVAGELEQAELNRLKQKVEADFKHSIDAKYPVKHLLPPEVGAVSPVLNSNFDPRK
jgi:hypothetical protein